MMILPRAVALAVCLAAGLGAQFRGLSTDGAGERVWFASDLRLRGSGQVEHSKLFRADSAGMVELVAERALEARYALLSEPEISSDAGVLSYEAGLSCPTGLTCLDQDFSHGVLAGGPISTEFPGKVAMSRSGRYFLRTAYAYEGPSRQVEIFDRLTGLRTPIAVSQSQALEGKWLVSSSGAALVYSDGLWLLRPDGKHVRLPTVNFAPVSDQPSFVKALVATMDDAGTLIVYQTTAGNTPSLLAVRPGDQDPREIVARAEGATNPVLSADGRRLLFLSGSQAWLMEMDTGAARRLSNAEAGIEEATLSADGRVVWASTYAGQILRIAADTGAAREIVSRTVSLDGPPEFGITLARGSLARLTGRGLAPAKAMGAVPLAPEIGGIRVDADGQALPLVSVSPFEIVFQAPWDLGSPGRIQLLPSASQFEDRLTRRIRAVVPSAPEFLRTAAGRPVIVHEDFRALVTARDGARPGEVLHLYLTGLGPVAPSVRTGQPAPSSPLARITGQLLASWTGAVLTNMPQPEILFAGLAPGLIGVYQVDVRVPLIAPATLGILLQIGDSGAVAQFEVSP